MTPAGADQARFPRVLLALILGQICLHACMTGLRMAAPLQALRQGHSEWAVGVVLALFALAPIALAMPAGRMADRHGYHRPIHFAIGMATIGGVVADGQQPLSGHVRGRVAVRSGSQHRTDHDPASRRLSGAGQHRTDPRLQLAGPGARPVERDRPVDGWLADRSGRVQGGICGVGTDAACRAGVVAAGSARATTQSSAGTGCTWVAGVIAQPLAGTCCEFRRCAACCWSTGYFRRRGMSTPSCCRFSAISAA